MQTFRAKRVINPFLEYDIVFSYMLNFFGGQMHEFSVHINDTICFYRINTFTSKRKIGIIRNVTVEYTPKRFQTLFFAHTV